MQTVTSATESKSHDLSTCVHDYTLRAPCPKGQGTRCLNEACKKIENTSLDGRESPHAWIAAI